APGVSSGTGAVDDRPAMVALPEWVGGIGIATAEEREVEGQRGCATERQIAAGEQDLIEIRAGDAGSVVLERTELPQVSAAATEIEAGLKRQFAGAVSGRDRGASLDGH